MKTPSQENFRISPWVFLREGRLFRRVWRRRMGVSPAGAARSVMLLMLISGMTVFPILFLNGCGGGDGNEDVRTGSPAAGGGETIQEEIMQRVSSRVLEDVPDEGRLRIVRGRGVLRAAFPPPEPGFQESDPEFGLPVGFNPSLVAEIARVMGVKPNMTILDRPPSQPYVPRDWEEKYDLLFLPPGAGVCGEGQEVKYFYTGPGWGWKTICAAGDGRALASAVREILSYQNETGIFARLYDTHFRGRKPAQPAGTAGESAGSQESAGE